MAAFELPQFMVAHWYLSGCRRFTPEVDAQMLHLTRPCDDLPHIMHLPFLRCFICQRRCRDTFLGFILRLTIYFDVAIWIWWVSRASINIRPAFAFLSHRQHALTLSELKFKPFAHGVTRSLMPPFGGE